MAGLKLKTDSFGLEGSPLAFSDQTTIFQIPEQYNAMWVPVGFQLSGTWNGATVTLEACMDTTASPLVFTPVANSTYTADTAGKWDLPVGCYFRLTVDTTSPLADISVALLGEIDIAR